ncbi:potassium channel family protein [Marinobacter sp. 71-i]|uniref:Potassium channel family protein n=1 Tax=Marinobacter iranensis TaxID=2962607 RepID=A0ABT5YCS8_9GAMM|nr:potassium channel family protein [Marinobacter iranensis]MDF0751479.1 potassium channel family protein [Marinobacter iranensis]
MPVVTLTRLAVSGEVQSPVLPEPHCQMPIIQKLRKLFAGYLTELSGYNLMAMLLCYTILSWIGLMLAGETALIQPERFFYWLVVTASTVGYGDFSPSTTAGRAWTAGFIVPAGLSLFAITIGRVGAFAVHHWQKGVKGLKDFQTLTGHIVVIGWNDTRTLHLLELLLKEESLSKSGRTIVMAGDSPEENPMPEKVHFVRLKQYTDELELNRTGLARASCIIVDTPEDDITLTCSLLCYQLNPKAHMIAYFNNERLSQLLTHHCPTVECTPSVAVEMLAKSAADPGSSTLHHDLLSVAGGMTQFSLTVPENTTDHTVGDLLRPFKAHFDALIIGVLPRAAKTIEINPTVDFPIQAGARIYYIANRRIHASEWEKLISD